MKKLLNYLDVLVMPGEETEMACALWQDCCPGVLIGVGEGRDLAPGESAIVFGGDDFDGNRGEFGRGDGDRVPAKKDC